MYLLDTNIISELRKNARAHPAVRAWIQSVPPATLYLSVMSILELRAGSLQVRASDPHQFRALSDWIDHQILASYKERILPITTLVADRCAELHVPTRRDDRDMLIAATALVHNLTVVTRNTRHFQPTGVRLINPWEPTPP